MLRHFYRLMIVALGLFVTSNCSHSEPMYGIILTDYDDATVDEDVADVDVADFSDGEAEIPDEDGDEPEFEDTLYGCPTVDYLIEGTVKSTTEVPIKGIEITSDLNYRYVPMATTGDDGAFSITANDGCFDEPQSVATLSIKDIDGAANGHYQDKELSVLLACTCDDPSSTFAYYVCTNTDVKIELEEAVSDDDSLLSDDDALLPDE